MRRILQLACLVLALICCAESQTILDEALDIGSADPCATELGVASPSDNLSCEIVIAAGNTRCYNRSELCNSNTACVTGSDEGSNIAALDCKLIIIIKFNVPIIRNVSKIRFWSSKWDGSVSLSMYLWRECGVRSVV